MSHRKAASPGTPGILRKIEHAQTCLVSDSGFMFRRTGFGHGGQTQGPVTLITKAAGGWTAPTAAGFGKH